MKFIYETNCSSKKKKNGNICLRAMLYSQIGRAERERDRGYIVE